MQQISREINEEVVRQLHRAKREYVKKRRLEGMDATAELPQARRRRLERAGTAHHHNNECHSQGALVPVVSAATAPSTSFEDLGALRLRNETTFSKEIDASGSALMHVNDITQDFYSHTQNEPAQVGRYDPDIARITNWPANWDQAFNQFLGIPMASGEEL